MAQSRVPVLPAGEVGQGKDGGTRADFSMLAASGVSTTWARSSDLGSESETETPRDTLPPSRCDLQSPLQGFRYTSDMEKLAEGRIVASLYSFFQLDCSGGLYGSLSESRPDRSS